MADDSDATRITRRDSDGVALLTLDYPGRTLNVVDESVFAELRAHVARIVADPAVRAAVVASGKSTGFGAGADVEWLPELVGRPDADAFLADVHALMRTIADSPKPYVAAVDGVALGGALEVILSTHAIVATPRSTLGLPEITLGLIPGGAGTQLLRRFVDTRTALEMLGTGRALDAVSARDAGLLAEIADEAELVPRAMALALRLADGASGVPPYSNETTSDAIAALDAEPGGESSAHSAIREVVRVGVERGWDAGCAQERTRFLELVQSPEARARIHLFTAEGRLKRAGTARSAIAKIGVVGGGQMGSGIAATAVSRGLAAVVQDVGDEQLDRSRSYLERVLDRSAPDRAAELAAQWSATTQWSGFDSADAVIEAVFELPDVKREALAEVSSRVSGSTLIATNTSAIPVGTLADGVSRPERFLGMHFFSPVERMPLVELVPHEGTSPESVDRAGSIARRLGKVPIVVADVPGFFTSRVYARWLVEGIRLLLDGVEPSRVDAAAKAAGFPIGPLQAHDEATLDLVVKASITQVAERVLVDRIDVAGVREALESLIAGGVLGRRQGQGFYLYAEGRRTGTNPIVSQIIGATGEHVDDRAIRDRLLLAFATECFLCWDEGTICHPDDGDLGAVLGIGFPRHLGGPFQWADAQGAAAVMERCVELGKDAFPEGARLEAFLQAGGSFAAETRLAAPRGRVYAAEDQSSGR